MSQKNIFIITLLVLLLVGITFAYYNFHKPIETKEIKDSPFSVMLQNKKETFSEGTDWYDTKIEYPKDSQKIRDQIFSLYNDFVKDTGIKNYDNLAAATSGLQINVPDLKYSFYAEYKIATSTNTLTYIYQIYNFTGGAHGSTTIVPITVDEKGQIIPVSQILPDSKLATVAKLAEADIRKQKTERMRSYGSMTEKEIQDAVKNDDFIKEGVAPARDNYNSLWYEGENIVISFGQYQVGPYAEGLYEVRIPKTAISN